MDCEDAHLDYTVIEPGGASHSLDGIHPLSVLFHFSSPCSRSRAVDDVSAQYVHDGLPEEWRRQFNVQQIEEALMNVGERNIREGKTVMDLEARVAEALAVLSGHAGTTSARS
jgi:hypothetical protein